MSRTLICNVDIFDGVSPDLLEGHHVLVENGRIKDISAQPIKAENATVIEGDRQTLMPGLIDAHYHACLVKVNGYQFDNIPPSILYPAAARLLTNSLRRGFTTVRDAGGADYGLAHATKTGLINGPRIFFSGRPLTQTGGHGDTRSPHQDGACQCGIHNHSIIRVVDGVDEVRHAARDEFRKGAHQLKLMLNGGVSSESDPVWLCQFSDEEICVAIEEAKRRKSYVMAHLYMDEQIRHAVNLGVRSVEHGNFLSLETARLMAAKGAFLVPTLGTYKAIHREGEAFGFNDNNFAKLDEVMAAGLQSLENAVAANVNIGFGTDLLGDMHAHQCEEFMIRAKVQSPFEILRSATSVNASLLQQAGHLGEVTAGACADLILIKGNPLNDLTLFDQHGTNISMIMKDGRQVL